MRQGIPIILMVLLLVSTTPLLGSYIASGPLSLSSRSGYTESSMMLSLGILSPITKVHVSSLVPSRPIGDSASSQPQTLGAIRPAIVGPTVLGAVSSSSSVSVLSGFDGLNQIQSCTCVPPDVQVTAGPNHVVEMVNLEGEIFSKQGITNKTFTLASFFKTGSDSISDPKVLFDSLSGRWFTSMVDVTLGSILVGVSSTSDPTGTWTLYALSAGGNLPDQPIIGVSNDEFVVSSNDFFSRSFVGAQYWVLNKGEMLTGSAVSFATSGANSGFFSIHPVQSLSSTKTQYMVGTIVSKKFLVTTSMELFSVAGVPGVSSVIANTTALTVSTLGTPPGGVQPGTTSTVNTGDFRVQDAAWFMGKLWYGLDDACTPGGDTQVRACIRLTMIDTATSPATIKQDFDFGINGQYLFYPTLKIDKNSDLDLTYGYSSSTIFPSLAATGQALTDPANSLTPPQTLKAGSAADTSTRYGDYFGSGLDPSNPTIVWIAGEYHSSTTGACNSFGSCWSTFIGSIMMITPIPVSLDSIVSFSGVNVNTTGRLAINTVNSTMSGSATIVARNSTTGTIIITKTYTISSIKLQNQMPNLEASFLLNLAITPYPISSDIIVTLSGGVATTGVLVTRQIDLNGDGTVDIVDVAIVAFSFGSSLGSPNYNPYADLDANGTVNINDVAIAAFYFAAPSFT
jgi:dockerin type I repeat protein